MPNFVPICGDVKNPFYWWRRQNLASMNIPLTIGPNVKCRYQVSLKNPITNKLLFQNSQKYFRQPSRNYFVSVRAESTFNIGKTKQTFFCSVQKIYLHKKWVSTIKQLYKSTFNIGVHLSKQNGNFSQIESDKMYVHRKYFFTQMYTKVLFQYKRTSQWRARGGLKLLLPFCTLLSSSQTSAMYLRPFCQ